MEHRVRGRKKAQDAQNRIFSRRLRVFAANVDSETVGHPAVSVVKLELFSLASAAGIG